MRVERTAMTRVHAELVGERAILTRSDFERLLELARRSAPVEVELVEDEIPTQALMKLAADGGSFDWLAKEEDLYSEADLRVRYRRDAARSYWLRSPSRICRRITLVPQSWSRAAVRHR
jgi:hypothetical protein